MSGNQSKVIIAINTSTDSQPLQQLPSNAMPWGSRSSMRNSSPIPTLLKPSLVCVTDYILFAPAGPSNTVDLQHKTWHSKAYSHFIMPPAITTMDSGEIGYKFICKGSAITSLFILHKFTCAEYPTCSFTSDSSKHVTCSHVDESTSNLVWHANTCNPSTSAAIPALSSFDWGRFQYLIAAWSAQHARPLIIIEDGELCEMITSRKFPK